MSEEPGKYSAGRDRRHTHAVKDEAPVRDHFAQVPNIVDEMNLSPQAYRLYGHLRRVIGEGGSCWQSTATMAKACNMSAGAVSQAKKELMFHAVIRVEIKQKKEGGFYHDITLVDLWKANHEYFTTPEARSQYERVHNMNERVHNMKPRISPLKNTPLTAKTQKRGDILDGMLFYSGEHSIEMGMRTRFEKALSLSPSWDKHSPRDSWERFDLWLIQKDIAGESIERWAAWWLEDDFRKKTTHLLTPDKIKLAWQQAFARPDAPPEDTPIPALPDPSPVPEWVKAKAKEFRDNAKRARNPT